MQLSHQYLRSPITRGALRLARWVAPNDPIVQAALNGPVLRWYCRELQAMETYDWDAAQVGLRAFELSVAERRRAGGLRFAAAIALLHTAASNPGVMLCGLITATCLPLLYVGLGIGHLFAYTYKLV